MRGRAGNEHPVRNISDRRREGTAGWMARGPVRENLAKGYQPDTMIERMSRQDRRRRSNIPPIKALQHRMHSWMRIDVIPKPGHFKPDID